MLEFSEVAESEVYPSSELPQSPAAAAGFSLHSRFGPHKLLEAREESVAHYALCSAKAPPSLEKLRLVRTVLLFPGFSSLQGSPLNGNLLDMKCAVSGNLVSLSGHYERGFLSKKNF